ncbi:hypothetical protein Agub_g11754 [Astrephomene gubernaculifera]|uniref:Uncharacterized protein n=1 Tax=Astrephomene gubernaculifera TaxID=47775 RepID=A0AAD3DXE5_9CHLO|nr:hypothetical protein Agub_g11754 [Astrephomene gubernaculifera]
MALTRGFMLLALLGCTLGLSAARTTYVFVIFGDSLSDTGNTLRAAGVPDPAIYYKGRFTNGPNWVDRLNATFAKKCTAKVFNYAYGGATACPNPGYSQIYPYIKDLTNQTASFLSDYKTGKIPRGPGVKIIPIQWIGSNDLMLTLMGALNDAHTDPLQLAATINATVACRVQWAKTLALAGLKDIVMLPMSPVHLAPLLPAAAKPMVIQALNALDTATTAAVGALQAHLKTIHGSRPAAGARIHLLGNYTWIEAGGQEVKPPFTDMTGPCVANYLPLVIHPGLEICANPNDHLFYDTLHIGSRFHQWLGVKGILPRLQQLRLLPKTI